MVDLVVVQRQNLATDGRTGYAELVIGLMTVGRSAGEKNSAETFRMTGTALCSVPTHICSNMSKSRLRQEANMCKHTSGLV